MILRLFVSTLLFGGSAVAASNIYEQYKAEAKSEKASFTDFDIEEGKKLYFLERVNAKGEKISCTTCHTNNPKLPGKSKANKVVEPIAPAANKERFTDKAKVEKWFTRNCKEVLDRPCTVFEKGNFIKYLNSIN